jgi:P-type E1-E2 ATPase
MFLIQVCLKLVKLIKHSEDNPVIAAIGDGANDVSMIQEANVGIGLYGKEGRNAARSADFALGKFKFLKRLLLVHGYLFYTRGSFLVQYFFYKNLSFAIGQFYFSFSDAFSVSVCVIKTI